MTNRVLITGGAGFLGKKLARKLLERGQLDGRAIDKLVLLDVAAPADLNDPRIETLAGDIADPAVLERAIDRDTQSVFHLAAVVSGAAEADFDLGMRINLDASRHLLERCRALGHVPRVIFTSSVAAFGGKLPAAIPDDFAPTPMSSYGAQKVMGELMVSDYSRKGFIDGRTLRMPTISVRPGKPNAAASSFASGMIREPLNGEAAVAPVSPETRMWLMSPRLAIENLIHGHEVDAAAIGFPRSISLPGLSVSVRDMLAALRAVAGDKAADLVRWEPDDAIKRIVESWPGEFAATRAKALGFKADASFADVVRAYMADELGR
jgi:nucleoside-diphosphate-sugar epimerase